MATHTHTCGDAKKAVKAIFEKIGNDKMELAICKLGLQEAKTEFGQLAADLNKILATCKVRSFAGRQACRLGKMGQRIIDTERHINRLEDRLIRLVKSANQIAWANPS